MENDDKVIPSTKMYPKRNFRRCISICGCSISVIILGIVIICLKSVIYKAVIGKMFMLQPNSQSFDMWVKNPVPLTLKLHLFNWTNAADVFNRSVKPYFQDLGPYYFDETKEKVNITWNSNNTVSFYHLKKWWFNPDKSNGTLSDPIVSVNPIALSSAASAKDWSYIFQTGLSLMLSSVLSHLYSSHSAGEVLFDGYKDPLLDLVNNLPTIGRPSMPEYDKFGWFYTRNNSETYEGHFNMDTGVSGQLGELYSWKHMNQTPYNQDECGKVQGSAGEFFPTEMTKDTIIKFFSADLCRYVELEFDKEVTVNGLLGYKYSAGDRFLDNGTIIPENKCFCKGDCMPYGALDISACRYGSPAYVSLPHFHKADPYYTSIIDGVQSDEEKHDFFMIFEPKTGMPLQVNARLQVNLLLQPVSDISLFANAPKIYVPILWFEQSVLIPDHLILFISILKNFETICIGVGVSLILLSILVEVIYCHRLCNMKLIHKKEPVLTHEEVPLNGIIVKA